MNLLKNALYSFSKKLHTDQLPKEEIHIRIENGIHLSGAPFLVLICSSIIASIGLNIDSTGAVLGAKLISPIMIMILGMAYGLSTNNHKISKHALKLFLLQFIIIIITSTIYFKLSPIKIPTNELITKTQVSIFDIFLAFFGGAACVIATTRFEKYNVLPGVAIATSLLPPVATIGYGIATLQPNFIFGAFYLFLINTVFLMLSIYLFFKIINYSDEKHTKKTISKKRQYIFIIFAIIISTPIFVKTGLQVEASYEDSLDKSLVYTFIKNEIDFSNTTILETKVDTDNKVINILAIGDVITEEEKRELTEKLPDYDLADYSINLIQGTDNVLIEYFKYKNEIYIE